MPTDPKPASDLVALREAVLRFITNIYGPDVSAELLIYTNFSLHPGRIPFGDPPEIWRERRDLKRRLRRKHRRSR